MDEFHQPDVVRRVAEHGGYSIVKENPIGWGAFSTVYLAESSDGEEVAIKVFDTERTASHEAEILRSLSSSVIVKMIAFYEVVSVFALVIEYFPNGNLDQYLTTSESLLTKGQRLTWYSELASGVEHIHQVGITHCDIKPANMLISSNFNLKICDFGGAKTAEDLERQISPDDVLFEDHYSLRPFTAPEIFNEHLTQESDLFSLGLVFVMIAERPTPLVPIVEDGSRKELGRFLSKSENDKDRSKPPTTLLAFDLKNATNSEIQLFDRMLQFDYQKRPKACEIVVILKTICMPENQPLLSR